MIYYKIKMTRENGEDLYLSNKRFMSRTKNPKLYTSKLWAERKIESMDRWRNKFARERLPYKLVKVEIKESEIV